MPSIEIHPIMGLPEIRAGDDVASLVVSAAVAQTGVRDGDIFVVAQKIVSKAEGCVVRLDAVDPSPRARAWAGEWGKDPRVVELVLRESKRIVRMEKGVIVSETMHGFVCANAGVDISNAEEGTAILLPADPDASARGLRAQLEKECGAAVGVIVSDTFGRPWREGLVNAALGVAGIAPLLDHRGEKDSGGKRLQATVVAQADELASAAELVMGKVSRIPVALIRGATLGAREGSGRDLIRPAERDLFR